MFSQTVRNSDRCSVDQTLSQLADQSTIQIHFILSWMLLAITYYVCQAFIHAYTHTWQEHIHKSRWPDRGQVCDWILSECRHCALPDGTAKQAHVVTHTGTDCRLSCLLTIISHLDPSERVHCMHTFVHAYICACTSLPGVPTQRFAAACCRNWWRATVEEAG